MNKSKTNIMKFCTLQNGEVLDSFLTFYNDNINVVYKRNFLALLVDKHLT